MKKLTFFLLSIAVLAAVFTSCKKDTTNVAPVVTFANIADSALSVTATTDPYTLGITVTSDAGLSKVIIKETNGGTTSTKATISSFTDKLKYENQYAVTGIPTTGIIVTIEATDKNDLVTSRAITVTKQSTAGAINTYSAVLLGSNSNAAGSYLATTTGTVYHAGVKQANSSVIDICYGTTTGSVDEFFSPAIALAGITGGNSTKFATSTINYDNVTDDALLLAITATSDEITVSAVGNEFQFITHAGKKGIMKVTAFTAGTAGSVTINVKVQQ